MESHAEDIDLIVSNAIVPILPEEAVFELATMSISQYEKERNLRGLPNTHLYQIQAQGFTTSYGDFATITCRIENNRWQVWVGTEPEIQQKISEIQENEQSSIN